MNTGQRVVYIPSESDEIKMNWGGNEDPRKLLDPDKVYTVVQIREHSWHTKVWLEDAGGELGPFNSSHFHEIPDVRA